MPGGRQKKHSSSKSTTNGAASQNGSTGFGSSGTVRLRLLGGFELSVDDHPIKTTPSVRRVLAYLAVRNRPVRRCSLAGELWPETTDDRARANLRAALSRLPAGCGAAIEVTDDLLAIANRVEVDLHVATTTADGLLDRSDTDPAAIDPQLFRGELLPDFGDTWLSVERESTRQMSLHALETLSERLADKGHFGQAIGAALAAIRIDPLRESSTRVLIQAHIAEGNRSEAWRAYNRYRVTLDAELGIEPSAELVRLVGSDLTG